MDFSKIKTIKRTHNSQENLQMNCMLDAIDEIMNNIPYNTHEDWAEFGVFEGTSSRLIIKHLSMSHRLFLLDSFKGLPEKWPGKHPKGAFALKDEDIPIFNDDRVTVLKGLFTDTILELVKISKPLTFIHVDCDIYSSTLDVLYCLKLFKHFANPCYILFDELYNYKGWELQEYKAFNEVLVNSDYNIEPLFKTESRQTAIKIYK